MHIKLLQRSFTTFLISCFTLIVGLYKLAKKHL